MRQARRRARFVDLRTAEVVPPEAPRLFLGRFEEAELRQELERAGILEPLRARGFADLVVRHDYQAGEHELRVDASSGAAASLLELRIAFGATQAAEPLLRVCGAAGFSFLSVHRLWLQDPAREFHSERPKLPGQRYPGLGLLRPVLRRLREWAEGCGQDALMILPQYYHNAVFCSGAFRFVDPVRQGRFLALRRDLSLVHVAQASAAIEQGRVIEEPWGAPLKWEAGEMIDPLDETLRRCLESREYETAVERSRDAARFRLR